MKNSNPARMKNQEKGASRPLPNPAAPKNNIKKILVMKKFMLLAAVAATIFSSCSKDETVGQSDANAIGFESYVGKPTRGIPVSGNKFTGTATMKVWGYYTAAEMGTDLTGAETILNLAGATVTRGADDGIWRYSPMAYWKEGKFHNFFAVSPAAEVGIGYNAGKVTYTVQDAIADQEDFMVADPLKAAAAWDGAAAVSKPTFNFHHVLSQIKYSAKLTADSDKATEVKIKSIRVESMSADDDSAIATLATTGEVSIIAKTDAAAYVYVGAPTGTAASYLTTPTASVALAATTTVSDYVDVKHADDDILMLMPQKTVGKVRFTILFEYKNEAGESKEAEGIFMTNEAQTWEPNKIYSYKFDVNMPQVLDQKPVEFDDPKIEDWTTGDEVKPA